MNKSNSVSIQQAIQEAKREIERFVNAESDPMLRVILRERIDLSISNIADSIEKNYFEGTVIKRSDGSIDPSQSTITSDHLKYVRYSLEETKKKYLSQHDNVKSPADILTINVYYIITLFSIREEWDLWAIKQQLLADEAIPLMNGLDPPSWKEYQNKEKNLPLEMVDSIERCLKMAKSDGFVAKPPAEWITWGREHDLDKPILKSNQSNIPDICMFKLFETAVNAIFGESIKLHSLEIQKDDPWKEMAREKADLIYKKQKAIGCDPSKKAIANKIANEFEKEGIKTVKGKRLNDENIVRHALNTWKRPEK